MPTTTLPTEKEVKLTQYSHGAGCGCKIAPKILDQILQSNFSFPDNDKLLVGNSTKDDAAVYDIGNRQAIISTTDFFMPIVDDAYDFGRIASANAISDVYAMGGKPILAIAILGWPIDKIPPEVAGQVISGAKALCAQANIPLAGGHSIDSPEPIFGLAVNGILNIENLKRNDTALEGDLIFLTKPLGIGILSTASKKELLKENDRKISVEQMTTLNKIGEEFGKIKGINALTDVTGFGLLGHLCEMAEGSNLTAEINFIDVPLMAGLDYYIDKNCIPGGTNRNWKSYGNKISPISERVRVLLSDPQTSGGLLVSLSPESEKHFQKIIKEFGLEKCASKPIGKMVKKKEKSVVVFN